jgi:uncharacterized repeat protein (TIGR03803 family)
MVVLYQRCRVMLLRCTKPLAVLLASIAVAAACMVTVTPAVAARREKVLRNFNNGNGAWPSASLIFDETGKLYGTTTSGGAYGVGTVFQLIPGASDRWTEKVLHSFHNDGKDGYWPIAGVTFDAGNLYGTNTRGGTQDYGAVFRLRPSAGGEWTEEVLYSFGSGKDGSNPDGGVIFDSTGNLYGTTYDGGSSACGGVGCGTVFRLTHGARGKWVAEILHRFHDDRKDGHHPYAGMVRDLAGNLYGTTVYGPTSGYFSQGPGTVFELKPSTNGRWTEKVLYTFCSLSSCADGNNPYAGLIFDAAGSLYGTTTYGGATAFDGNVFQLTPDGKGKWTESVVYTFCAARYYCNDGIYPYASLIFDAFGNLYGTTYEGTASNSYCAGFGCGIVFQLTPGANGTWSENVLYSFNGEDGGMPYAGVVIDSAGKVYGTTNGGGIYGNGTVFKIAP